MQDLTAKRTLVKSPPELWNELSEVERLARHLDAFGEIKITKLEPEHTVAWEGEHASGTVEIEAAGWGTKVTLKAEVREVEPPEPPPPPPAPDPPRPTVHKVIPDLEAWDHHAAEIERAAMRHTPAAERAAEQLAERAERERKRGLLGWLFRSRPAEPEELPPDPEPVSLWSDQVPPEPPPEPEPEPVVQAEPAVDEDRARAVLEATLDNLGSAHHRPFSRG